MAVLHNLYWDFLFSCQMICKQHIVLNHMFFQYESNLKPITYKSSHPMVYGSLWADTDLGRTNPEDWDSSLDYG